MKKMLQCAAGAATLGLFSGCASAPALTPPQIAQLACPPIQSALTQLSALGMALPDASSAQQAAAMLDRAREPVAAACTATATITASDVEGLARQAMPALGRVLATVPMPASTQAIIQTSLVGVEVIVGAAGVIEQQLAATKPSEAAASAPAASSAVGAAS